MKDKIGCISIRPYDVWVKTNNKVVDGVGKSVV